MVARTTLEDVEAARQETCPYRQRTEHRRDNHQPMLCTTKAHDNRITFDDLELMKYSHESGANDRGGVAPANAAETYLRS